jgi:catalase
MDLKPAVRYDPQVESREADESQTIAELNQAFDTILQRTAEDYGHAVRAVHAKSHGVLKGTLTVDPDLAPELAQGLFAKPGRHDVLVRLSTNAGDILPDAISLPRGFAMKVLDVEGERLPGSEGNAQDFVMVNGPVFHAPNAQKFLGGLKLLARTTDRMEGTKKAASAVLRGVHHVLGAVGATSATVDTLGGAPNVEPLGETYFSAVPFRYGDHIAKFILRPASPTQKTLTGNTIAVDGRENAIREEVQRELRTMEASWEFCVQLCRDLAEQPVEDPTVEWQEEASPWQRVGIVYLPPQDSWAPEQVQQIDEATRFSVWTGLAAHQPLGNVNRARRETYRHSADFRASFNGCPYHEPGSL